jgi:hypothetical protein
MSGKDISSPVVKEATKRFADNVLPGLISGTEALLAHPGTGSKEIGKAPLFCFLIRESYEIYYQMDKNMGWI